MKVIAGASDNIVYRGLCPSCCAVFECIEDETALMFSKAWKSIVGGYMRTADCPSCDCADVVLVPYQPPGGGPPA
jgi:hypothetical protein